ncbi:MAG: hypothetical protein ACFFAN_00310 [Promethearchaeota archaeon]
MISIIEGLISDNMRIEVIIVLGELKIGHNKIFKLFKNDTISDENLKIKAIKAKNVKLNFLN